MIWAPFSSFNIDITLVVGFSLTYDDFYFGHHKYKLKN